MNKVLIILTHTYPNNPPQEQFLDGEIEIASKNFDSIHILPISRVVGTNGKYTIFQNNVHTITKTRKSKIWEVITGLLISLTSDVYFLGDLITIFFHKNKVLNFIETLKYYINASSFYSQNRNIFDTIGIKKHDEVLLYSYWLNSTVYIAVKYKNMFIKKGFTNIKLISRAHGLGDLYIGNEKNTRRPILKQVNKSIDRIYCISKMGYDHLVSCNINPEILTISRLGTESSCNGVFSKNTISNEIITCSAVNDNKRILQFIHILSEYSETQVKWTHFGDGPLFNEAVMLAKKHLKKNIMWEIKGSTPNKDIIDYYLTFKPRIFINLSLIEGIPVSIMEAQAYGIPVIATRVGATSEIITDKYNGYLIAKFFKKEDLISRIIMIMNMTNENYLQLSKNSYFTWDNYYNSVRNYATFYSSLSSLWGMPK